jgi:hypothetical protein
LDAVGFLLLFLFLFFFLFLFLFFFLPLFLFPFLVLLVLHFVSLQGHKSRLGHFHLEFYFFRAGFDSKEFGFVFRELLIIEDIDVPEYGGEGELLQPKPALLHQVLLGGVVVYAEEGGSQQL